MSRRQQSWEVLSPEEMAEDDARARMEAQPMRHRGGIARVNSDGWSQRGEFYGVPGQWDDTTWRGDE